MMTQLRFAADVIVSNVDKKSKLGEQPVRLVNYTDVYYHDQIVADMDLLGATASPDQLVRFAVRPGDSIVTKDSETPDDIAVPTYVESASTDMVCGYHLAIIRPVADVDARYLNWALRAPDTRTQFHAAANGMTRYGLSYESIQAVRVPLPPLPRQIEIASHLSSQVAVIDSAIACKADQFSLLEDYWRSAVHEIVHGLIQSLPGTPLRYVLTEIDQRSTSDEEHTLLSVSIHRGVVPRSEISEEPSRAESLAGYKVVRSGDLVLNRMRAFQGAVGVARQAGIVSPDYAVLRAGAALNPEFAHFLLRSPWFIDQMAMRLRGIGNSDLGTARTPRVNMSDLNEIPLPIPRVSEQESILRSLNETSERVAALRESWGAQVDRLKDLKKSLINESIWGRPSVGEVQA